MFKKDLVIATTEVESNPLLKNAPIGTSACNRDSTALEMKKLFREAYRLMAVELFRVPVVEAHAVFDDENPYYLKAEHFAN